MKVRADEIVRLLEQQSAPISVSEIIAKQNYSVSSRTIRRLLSELVEQGIVEKRGTFKATKYLIKSDSSLASVKRELFSARSQALLARVRMPLYNREPCTYNEAWLKAYTVNQTYYLSENMRNQLDESCNHVIRRMPAGTYARKIFNRMLIDLSYNSSRLEGNTYSLLETEKLVIEGRAVEGKLDAEKLMILNHKEAIRFLVEGIERIEVNLQNIRTLHFLLSDGLVASSDAGHVRNDSVRISATTYIPLDNPEKLSVLLTEIVDKARMIADPFEQSFFLLVHVAYLQAFIDVNKRTSRLAANIPLVKNNLAPLSFNNVNKQDYIDAMITIYELNETGPLTELYYASYLQSAKQYTASAEAMGIDVIKATYRNDRRQVISEIVNNCIIGNDLEAHIKQYAETIPAEHRNKFISDALNEIATLEAFKITGMGISETAFRQWQALYKGKA